MSRLPTLLPRQILAALKKMGFAEQRQSGSHLVLQHPDGRELVLPLHAKDVKRPTLSSILKQAGLTEDQFREYL